MKKVLLALVAVFTMGMAANAQNSLGLRIETDGSNGDLYFGSTELSFQHGMGAKRVELDLGFGNHDYSSYDYTHFCLTGVYQWTGNFVDNFGWYLGVGGQLGFWSYDYDNDYFYSDKSGAILSVAGQAGIEYNFQKVPLQLSLDWRPLMEIVGPSDGFDFHYGNVGLGVRYRF